MRFPSLNDLVGKAKDAFRRFPVTLVWAISGTMYTMLTVDGTLGEETNGQTITILTFILGISWLIGIQFFTEQQKHPKKWIWLKPTLLLLLFLFYWHVPDISVFDESPVYATRFFLFLIAGHLFVFFAPFISKWDKNAYWNYLSTLGSSVLRSGFFSGVLYLGLVLALTAVDALFEVRVDGDVYFQVFLFCLGIVNTWIYLSDFPLHIHERTEIDFKKGLEVFVTYILIPLIILYLLILYAYAFKIVVQWELPQGWVSYLVTALAFLGFTVQVIIHPVQKQSPSWTISTFHPWFYRLMLPLVGLLFIAIFRRISDYGITENRYFVVLIAFWILGTLLFLLFNKKSTLIVLPASLFILSLLASFGVWGAASVSQRSQIKQFQQVYEEVLANQKVMTSDQSQQLGSILSYLENRESLAQLNSTTGLNMETVYTNGAVHGTKGEYGWLDARKVLDSLGLVTENGLEEALNQNNYYYYNGSHLPIPYDIAGYQSMVPFVFWNQYKETDTFIGDYLVAYNDDAKTIELFQKTDAKHRVLAIPLKERLLSLAKNDKDLGKVDQKQFLIQAKNDSLSVLLIFQELDFYKQNEDIFLSRAKTLLLLNQN